MVTPRLHATLPLVLTLVPSAASLSPSLSQSPSRGHVDVLDRTYSTAADLGAAPRVVVASKYSLQEVPELQIFDAVPGTLEFVRSATLQPADFLEHWNIESVDVDGPLIAHTISKTFSTGHEVAIHEEAPSGWSTTRVRLPGYTWRWGDLAQVSGDRVVAASTPSAFRPITLHVIERDLAGGWEVVDAVETDVRSPWFDYEINIAFDGDVAAVGQLQGFNQGDVAVCERTPSGWTQTATLDGPESPGWEVRSMSLRDGVLAVARGRWLATPDVAVVLHIYERNAAGEWAITGRDVTSNADQQYAGPSLQADRDRVAVTTESGVRIYRKQAGGAWDLQRTIAGPLPGSELIAFQDGRLGIGSGGLASSAATVVEIPDAPGTGSFPYLRGLVTCEGTGAARLFVHDQYFGTERRTAAEITGAPPGRFVAVFRSQDPGTSVLSGGSLLCIDRANAFVAGPVSMVGPSGTVSIPLPALPFWSTSGFDAADHLQGVVFTVPRALTNSLAWLP